MKNLQTLTENYLEYCRTQKCLDEKTLKAYRIDLRQFSEESSLEKTTEITTNDLEDYIARLHQQYKGIQSFLGSLLFRVFRSGSSVGSFSRVWF